MDLRYLPLYFIVGGLTVAITIYFGSRGQGLLAAFVNLFPGITIITFIAIYFHGGSREVVSYARGILILVPAWILYITGIYLLVPRIGITLGMIISVAVFVIAAFLISRLT